MLCGGEARLGKHWRATPRRSAEELEAVYRAHSQCLTPPDARIFRAMLGKGYTSVAANRLSTNIFDPA
jgi:hypothetical protein